MALISLDHVNKIYPNATRPALEDVDLQIDRGDFVFLVGASGSGKTSLLRLLLREEEATGGEIRVAGYDLRRLPDRQVPQYRRSVGMIFQDYKLLTNKTVWENVAFALEVIGTPRSAVKSLVPKVLKTVGLTGKEHNRPLELSGGEQQRVTIARAYVNHPQILLADEPTGNLDPTTSLGIMEVLEAINRTGTTIVMATHNEEIVNSMRRRVVELHNGRIVRDQAGGVYDSALYFPDAQVEANAQQALAEERPSVRVQDEPRTRRERLEDAQAVIDSVNRALESASSDEGIARLAQSMHTGKTGRYGEAFAPVEDTLTWGGGLTLEEHAAQEGDAAAGARRDAAQEGDGHAQDAPVELEETTAMALAFPDDDADADLPMPPTPPAPPAPPTPDAHDDEGEGPGAADDADLSAPPKPPTPPAPPAPGHAAPKDTQTSHSQETQQ